RPLPHQLADRPRAPPRAVALSSFLSSPGLAARGPYPVLALLSKGYPGLRDRSPTCYSPVRHSAPQSVTTPRHRVRLACVKYAASVRSEPGSNSLSSSLLALCPDRLDMGSQNWPPSPPTFAARRHSRRASLVTRSGARLRSRTDGASHLSIEPVAYPTVKDRRSAVEGDQQPQTVTIPRFMGVSIVSKAIAERRSAAGNDHRVAVALRIARRVRIAASMAALGSHFPAVACSATASSAARFALRTSRSSNAPACVGQYQSRSFCVSSSREM